MRVLLVGTPADDESAAAAAWLDTHGFVWRQQEGAAASARDVEWADAVWCHSRTIWQPDDLSAALLTRLTTTGGVLLTQLACTLPAACGLEPTAPELQLGCFIEADDPLQDLAFRDWPDFPHIRGMQGWSGGRHPLFEGFVNGTYCRQLHDRDDLYDAGYLWPDWPTAGRVIAVERAYVRLNSRRAVAWEYSVGARRVLCLGAHVQLTGRAHALRAQRDRLLGNALSLAARAQPIGVADTAWPGPRASVAGGPRERREPGERARRLQREAGPIDSARPSSVAQVRTADDGPRIRSTGDADAPYTLAGRRAFAVGTERSGVDDLWIHPLAVVTGGIALTIHGNAPIPVAFQVTPVSTTRTLQLANATWDERVTPSHDQGHVLVEYVGDIPDGTEVTFQMPVRLEWPYEADLLAPLEAVLTPSGHGDHLITVTGADGCHGASVQITGASHVVLTPDPLSPRIVVHATAATPLQLMFMARPEGGAPPGQESTLPQDLLERREAHVRSLRQRTACFASPDESLNSAVAWAAHRLDMFLAVPPTGGLSLMAGYARSRTGWGESRPGYAWFFGRDACWSADAMLAVGMFEEVREIVRHLAATRDVTGKIYHELTTSEVCHYDAADATPLFLRLVARYYQTTGDRDTIHEVWDAVRHGVAFVASTDRDGDGLPENTDIGHGWIESGPLGGGRLTSYMAALWIDALDQLLILAEVMEDAAMGAWLSRARVHAIDGMERSLRDPRTGRLGLQRNADGSLVTDLTALSAVPIALGVDNAAASVDVLQSLTSPAFATPWGIRMLPNTHERYAPTGYHNGAVWPLFTGWTALACFARGRSRAGWELLRANASLAAVRAKGAFDEVLNGDTGQAAGVCPDQAWSAAMVIAPALHGLWGVRPSRGGRALTLRLQLPREWNSAFLDGLRVGGATLDIRVNQQSTEGECHLHCTIDRRDGAMESVAVEVLVGPGEEARAHGVDCPQLVQGPPGTEGTWYRWEIAAPRAREVFTIRVGVPS